MEKKSMMDRHIATVHGCYKSLHSGAMLFLRTGADSSIGIVVKKVRLAR